MEKKDNNIRVGVGYVDPMPIFVLRRVRKFEEQEFLAKHADKKGTLTPQQKEDFEQEVCITYLIKWSDKVPQRLEIQDGKEIEVPYYDDSVDIDKDVRRIFKEMADADSDVYRAVDALLYQYRTELTPNVLFH